MSTQWGAMLGHPNLIPLCVSCLIALAACGVFGSRTSSAGIAKKTLQGHLRLLQYHQHFAFSSSLREQAASNCSLKLIAEKCRGRKVHGCCSQPLAQYNNAERGCFAPRSLSHTATWSTFLLNGRMIAIMFEWPGFGHDTANLSTAAFILCIQC